MNTSSSRDDEEFMLDRCVVVGRSGRGHAVDEREANVFLLTAIVLETSHLQESESLRVAAEDYFERMSLRPRSVEHVMALGWIVNLPRLRDMLRARLHANPSEGT